MTEAEWLACDDPTAMLEFLWGKVSERKLRLFACACCRRSWHGQIGAKHRKAVEAAEAYADGRISREKLLAVHESIPLVSPMANPKFVTSLDLAHRFSGYYWGRVTFGYSLDEQRERAALFRHVIGSPFHQVAFDPACQTTTVCSLAETIYTDRAFDRMPILADALEDAGCTDRVILDHCRQPGEHVRGCWVVDLVLGKS